MFSLFSKDDKWNNNEAFLKLLDKYNDNLTKRENILSLGRAKNISYFRQNRMINVSTLDPWVARSFLVGISCLPKDERSAFYKSRNLRNRDFLEKIVEKWAANNCF